MNLHEKITRMRSKKRRKWKTGEGHSSEVRGKREGKER